MRTIIKVAIGLDDMKELASAPTPCPPHCQDAVEIAVSRLRRDIERFKPDRPAVIYALIGETHKAIMEDWRESGDLAEHMECLLEEMTALMRRLHAAAVSGYPANGGGMADRVRLEIQADVALEEVRRIELELQALRPHPLDA
jgi:hypothetical protein